MIATAGNPWMDYVVPNANMLFAFVAALFAVLAWRLARRQAALDDAERKRFPRLELEIDGQRGSITVDGWRSGDLSDGYFCAVVPVKLVSLYHSHTREAKKVVIEIELPGFLNVNDMDFDMDDRGLRKGWGFEYEHAEASDILIATKRIPYDVVPATSADVGDLVLIARKGTHNIRWMAKTSEGMFPREHVDPDGDGMQELTLTII